MLARADHETLGCMPPDVRRRLMNLLRWITASLTGRHRPTEREMTELYAWVDSLAQVEDEQP
jgi:hypothetical protein